MRCLGVDPGGTTGVAIVAYEGGRYSLEMHGGLTGDAAETLENLRAFFFESVPIAVERFVVNRRAGRSASAHAGEKARNLIGAIQALPRRGPGTLRLDCTGYLVHLENASQVKAWATDKRLSAAGFVFTNGRPHSRDAARHALYCLVKRYGCPDPLGAAYRKDTDQCRPDTQSC